MKSRRRAPRSRAVGWLNALWEAVVASIIYLGPPLICAVPLLFLYWLYRPIVLMNPGLSALREPSAVAVLLPPDRPEAREEVGKLRQAALLDSGKDLAEPETGDKKPPSRPGTGGSHPVASRSEVRIAGRAGRRAPERDFTAATPNFRQYTGMSRDPFSAYAYAAEQSGRYRW